MGRFYHDRMGLVELPEDIDLSRGKLSRSDNDTGFRVRVQGSHSCARAQARCMHKHEIEAPRGGSRGQREAPLAVRDLVIFAALSSLLTCC